MRVKAVSAAAMHKCYAAAKAAFLLLSPFVSQSCCPAPDEHMRLMREGTVSILSAAPGWSMANAMHAPATSCTGPCKMRFSHFLSRRDAIAGKCGLAGDMWLKPRPLPPAISPRVLLMRSGRPKSRMACQVQQDKAARMRTGRAIAQGPKEQSAPGQRPCE